VPRGGDLMLRYPDGSLRNLTREAGFGNEGLQGAAAIAVREPAVHWSGARPCSACWTGAPGVWQLYEGERPGEGRNARILPACRTSRPATTTCRRCTAATNASCSPRTGRAMAPPTCIPSSTSTRPRPTTTGIWRLDPASGALRILNHAPSGAFSPMLDSYGRVVFTRWDHQQQDQLAERDRDAVNNGVALPFSSFNFAGEAAGAAALSSAPKCFPSRGSGARAVWQGQRLHHQFLHRLDDERGRQRRGNPEPRGPARTGLRLPDTQLRRRPQPVEPHGRWPITPTACRCGARAACSSCAKTRAGRAATWPWRRASPRLHHRPAGAPGRLARAERRPDDGHRADRGRSRRRLAGGRFRNPLPLSDGRLVASHTSTERAPEEGGTLASLRLRVLEPDPASGLYKAGAALTPGIEKTVSWQTPAGLRSHSGALWEIEAVELRARLKPQRAQAGFDAPERAVLIEENVSEDTLRSWLASRDLALVVTRDQTSRDRADLQQPYNLRVPGGVKTVSKVAPGGKLYDIAHFQLFQADQLRAYPGRPGRRVIAQPLHDGMANNPANGGGPAGSVRIAADGSTAAFVPARRALTWQTTDPAGNAVVRERNWITFQPGEMRTCASCHGVNTVNQAGFPTPVNKPQALRELLKHWKTMQ
jgi:hypothetical protein